MKCFVNPRAAASSEVAPEWLSPFISLDRYRQARAEISSWDGYRPTPLLSLPTLAAETGVGAVWYKDEGSRFGLGSFKALGGAYAAARAMLRKLHQSGAVPATATIADLRDGRYARAASTVTLVTATDGNHGRSVAWGARAFGARSIIYLHEHVSVAREAAIRALGAEIVRVRGNYDDSVRKAAEDAAANAYVLVSDTSYEGYLETPADVMQGYTVMVGEILDDPEIRPTHVFLQAGVGALAAAVCAHLWQAIGASRPYCVVVESDRADCLYRSAEAGRPVTVEGDLDTVMAGLACGEVSELAWRVLDRGANAFMSIDDDHARAAMRRLYRSSGDDPRIIAGESGAAGLAGLLAAAREERAPLGLDAASRVLLFGTESDTDPGSFAEIVARPREAEALAWRA